MAAYGISALTNMNMQRKVMMLVPLRFFMNENLMMTIPQQRPMTNMAGAMLEYNNAVSQPNVVVSKKRYNIVNPMIVPRMT